MVSVGEHLLLLLVREGGGRGMSAEDDFDQSPSVDRSGWIPSTLGRKGPLSSREGWGVWILHPGLR